MFSCWWEPNLDGPGGSHPSSLVTQQTAVPAEYSSLQSDSEASNDSLIPGHARLPVRPSGVPLLVWSWARGVWIHFLLPREPKRSLVPSWPTDKHVACCVCMCGGGAHSCSRSAPSLQIWLWCTWNIYAQFTCKRQRVCRIAFTLSLLCLEMCLNKALCYIFTRGTSNVDAWPPAGGHSPTQISITPGFTYVDYWNLVSTMYSYR